MTTSTESVSLEVNGEPREVPAGTTIAGLIEPLELGRTACAVEVNRELAPKATHEAHTLQSGDTIEIVTLVGGG
ncbi:MAG: sulfur carrier protein ThiS [Phycisphaerales bacterium]